MLSGNFKEAANNLVELHEDTICSAELWFRTLHGNLADGSYLIQREDIYNAIAFSRTYFLHIEKLNEYLRRTGLDSKRRTS
jgi:DNA polymerase III delta prime subunit